MQNNITTYESTLLKERVLILNCFTLNVCSTKLHNKIFLGILPIIHITGK
ncbi:MAG: hypothetical protein ACXAC7_03370 [Candidatus Hodarchaeales archaeon]